MRSVQEHLAACLAAVGPQPPLDVVLADAIGCVLAEDVVQQAWLRLDRTLRRDPGSDTTGGIENLPAWLTTVTTRLCLDRLRARTPVPVEDEDLSGLEESAPDPADFTTAPSGPIR